MAYKDLSMKQKADIIKMFVQKGYTRLPDIERDYNSFAEGGDLYNKPGLPKPFSLTKGVIPPVLYDGGGEFYKGMSNDVSNFLKGGFPLVAYGRAKEAINKVSSKFSGGSANGGGATMSIPYYNEYAYKAHRLIPEVQTFNEAFEKASKEGKETFEFNGKAYTTKKSNKPGWKEAGDNRTEFTGNLLVDEKKDLNKQQADSLKRVGYMIQRYTLPKK